MNNKQHPQLMYLDTWLPLGWWCTFGEVIGRSVSRWVEEVHHWGPSLRVYNMILLSGVHKPNTFNVHKPKEILSSTLAVSSLSPLTTIKK